MRTLIEVLGSKHELADAHLAALKIIDKHDYSGVRRKVREWREKDGLETTEQFLDEGVLALKQYYVLPVVDPLNSHSISKEVDPFWHAHILHTKDYADFCDAAIGSFMHHEPLDHADTVRVDQVDKIYQYTIQVFRDTFAYLNNDFYPTKVRREDLICPHFGAVYPDIEAKALYPKDPKMQLAA